MSDQRWVCGPTDPDIVDVFHGHYGAEPNIARPRKRRRVNVKRRGVTIYRGAGADDTDEVDEQRIARRAEREQARQQRERDVVNVPRKRPQDRQLAYNSDAWDAAHRPGRSRA